MMGSAAAAVVLPWLHVPDSLERSAPLLVAIALALHLDSPVCQDSCSRNVLAFSCQKLLDCPVLASLGKVVAIEPAQVIRHKMPCLALGALA